MKKSLITLVSAMALLSVPMTMSAQGAPAAKEDGFKFEVIKQLPITSVKNQSNTGTCWCFAVTSFMESEALRKGYKGDLDLSEMFTVYNAYQDRAAKYVRTNKAISFSEGSSFGDVLSIMKEYGAVPESAMTGLNYGSTKHNHSELVAGLSGYVSGIANSRGALTTVWPKGVKAILDVYLGEAPETFSVNGKNYTPKTYFQSLGINPSDYVELTSWSHLSFYEQHPIESSDNWRWETAYNIPIDEFMEVLDYSINKGYTFAWGSDVSETGFTRDGIGYAPDMEAVQAMGSDQARFQGGTTQAARPNVNGPVKEIEVTQESRQLEYDIRNTTEDHAMHAFGIAKDQNGTKYYMIKNSWGETGKYKGIWYVSETFVKWKTLAVMVHKDAITSALKAKLGI